MVKVGDSRPCPRAGGRGRCRSSSFGRKPQIRAPSTWFPMTALPRPGCRKRRSPGPRPTASAARPTGFSSCLGPTARWPGRCSGPARAICRSPRWAPARWPANCRKGSGILPDRPPIRSLPRSGSSSAATPSRATASRKAARSPSPYQRAPTSRGSNASPTASSWPATSSTRRPTTSARPRSRRPCGSSPQPTARLSLRSSATSSWPPTSP